MIRINLLPYRDEHRQSQILQYIMVALAALAVTGVIILATYSWSSMQLVGAQDRLQEVQAKNKALKAKLGELTKFEEVQAEVQKKLDLVDKLQQGRFRSLQTLLGLSAASPRNIWLTAVQDSGGSISLSGFGESNRAVAIFMRSLEEQDVFSGVNLQVIKRQRVGDVPLRSFSLTMKRVETSDPSENKKKAKKTARGKAS